ncbi:Sua5/YciO/YrdC/YwlC family protein [Gallaecimonas sp. GXIMD4217]|uniref:Sua5/YciO/YrdC/YwlC family protein n=1 Tax=Gallaecimonas sp. GXIMD4217 TaxID=3131927 RepID=UPI00311ACB8F
MSELEQFVEHFHNGGVLAYPTEAVFGLGCDPDNEAAVNELLRLKERDPAKGLILVAANYSQVLKYIRDGDIPIDRRFAIFSKWPGPVTWVLPARADAPAWVTGGRDTLAVRVSDHPVVKALCDAFGKPLVSTSANLSGQEPARSAAEVAAQFGERVLVVPGEVGSLGQPTPIFDAQTGQALRS